MSKRQKNDAMNSKISERWAFVGAPSRWSVGLCVAPYGRPCGLPPFVASFQFGRYPFGQIKRFVWLFGSRKKAKMLAQLPSLAQMPLQNVNTRQGIRPKWHQT
jgi:hypothetical protein